MFRFWQDLNGHLTSDSEFRAMKKDAEFGVFLENLGRSGLEPPTSPLSGVRSNHLS